MYRVIATLVALQLAACAGENSELDTLLAQGRDVFDSVSVIADQGGFHADIDRRAGNPLSYQQSLKEFLPETGFQIR
jgi:hypothetical protein